LATNKVKVVLNGRNEEALTRTVDSIQASGGQALGVIADCTQSHHVDEMCRKVEKRWEMSTC
jgi:NADP-dependent 3-hydroxy acid dehydrogenase YdfG